MNTPSLSSTPFPSAEPIPGYTIQERIGAGGYGEVWRAEAPGGIAKAVKIVHGYLDDDRAARELKSLNRIKEVRHPFLLSLDRIEVVENHLLIVSELASSSLKDRFEQCRADGREGLPRDELLMHLRDVADALDYICENYSLQHLDIKPENLLLVGGRVKVADFGLVKELHDVQSSFMGGLTPVYAPPEVFDGRPNRHSDQYSLAIVYQELLTGVLPFQGRTTAQLAAQHLHGKPNLSPLPLADQATVARALSKQAESRFADCRAFIEALRAPRPATPIREQPIIASVGVAPGARRPTCKTEVLDGGADAYQVVQTQVSPAEPAETAQLPPLELDAKPDAYRPTIFVGVGGLAGRALLGLRRRLTDRFGDLDALPTVRMLWLDTDCETMRELTEGDARAALPNDAAVALPLRQTSDYRRESDRHLQWMSRRWLYNIPRSRQTKGFRPLGRLAFVDHAQRFYDAFDAALRQTLSEEAVTAARENAGLEFDPQAPRVMVVASITGGTGSGMVVDLGYAIRKMLAERGLPDDAVVGVLAHCTDRRQQSRDVAMANSYACLSELQHYSRPESPYPGDASCDLPPFQPGEAAFRDAYLVHLGEELDDRQFTAAADNLAEYLYRAGVTPAAQFFDRCRRATREETQDQNGGLTLRSFALAQLGGSFHDLPSLAAEGLCRALVDRWRGVDTDQPAQLSRPGTLLAGQLASGASAAGMDEAVVALADSLGLVTPKLVDQVAALVAREMGAEPDAYLRAFLEEVLNQHEAARGPALDGRTLLDAIDAVVRAGERPDADAVSLDSALAAHLERTAADTRAKLREWILAHVESSPARVKTAQTASERLSEFLQLLHKQTDELLRRPRGELAALEKTLLNDRVTLRRGLLGRKVVVDHRLLKYFRLRVQEATYCGVFQLLEMLQAEVSGARGQLRDLWRDLNRLSGEFAPPREAAPACLEGNGEEAGVRDTVFAALRARQSELVAQLDEQLRSELLRVLNDKLGARQALLAPLRAAARNVARGAIRQIDMGHLVTESEEAARPPVQSLCDELQTAAARLNRCGGGRRLLLILPEHLADGDWRDTLADELAARPTLVRDADNDIVLCYESEQLPTHRVAVALVDHHPDYMQLAARLHTRIDVEWSPL